MDAQRRTFLFELLCFAGDFDRAVKHLDVVAQGTKEANMGALLYQSALHAERTRQQMFEKGDFPSDQQPRPVAGTVNGQAFESFADADPRIGARLEIFAAGEYTWIPLEHVASVKMEAPKRLRDLLWMPAIVETGPKFEGLELGEVLLPVMTPLAWRHENDEVRLGRVTEWQALEDGSEVPVGQKMWLVDNEVFPLLEVRELEIQPASNTAD